MLEADTVTTTVAADEILQGRFLLFGGVFMTIKPAPTLSQLDDARVHAVSCEDSVVHRVITEVGLFRAKSMPAALQVIDTVMEHSKTFGHPLLAELNESGLFRLVFEQGSSGCRIWKQFEVVRTQPNELSQH
jgi:hypothetical protein